MKCGYNVCDAMTMNPVIVSQETSIKDCAKLMAEKKISSLIISENEELLGIIKEIDIVRSIVLENKDAEKELVRDFMIENVVTITPDVDIYEALLVMRDEDVRMLPVVVDDKIIGLLTVKDILKIQPELFEILAEKLILREEDRNSN